MQLIQDKIHKRNGPFDLMWSRSDQYSPYSYLSGVSSPFPTSLFPILMRTIKEEEEGQRWPQSMMTMTYEIS